MIRIMIWYMIKHGLLDLFKILLKQKNKNKKEHEKAFINIFLMAVSGSFSNYNYNHKQNKNMIEFEINKIIDREEGVYWSNINK